MSWNNIIPWFVLCHWAWERAAKESCAIAGEYHVSEFREDFWP